MRRAQWTRLGMVLAVLVPAAAAAEQIRLRVALQVPASNPLLGRSVVQFKQEVEKETEGALGVEIHDRGKLYIDDEIAEAVQVGAVEMGLVGINQISRRFPAADIMELPFLFNFEALTRAATSPESELRRLLDQAVVDALGVRVLWWQTAGSQVFVSKGLEVADPSRIRQRSVRVFSDAMASFTQLCGGRPQMLSVTRVHDALEDGAVDVVMTPAIAVETHGLWRVADTITRTDHAGVEYLVIINEKTWNGLTDVHKAAITEAARRAERDVRDKAAKLEEKAYDFARSKGMTVHELTPDQVAEWRACSADLLDSFMIGGGEFERRLLKAYGKLRTAPCCSAGPSGAGYRR